MSTYNQRLFESYLQSVGAYGQKTYDSAKFIVHNSIPITPGRLEKYVSSLRPEDYMRAFGKKTVAQALNANIQKQSRTFYANSPLLITKGREQTLGEVMSSIGFEGNKYRIHVRGGRYPSYSGLNRLETSSVYTMSVLSRQAVHNILDFLNKALVIGSTLYALKVIGGFVIHNFDGTECILLDYFRTNNEPGVYRRFIDKHGRAIREGLLNEDFSEKDIQRRIKSFDKDIAEYKAKIAEEPDICKNIIKAFNDVGISWLIMFGSVKHAYNVYLAFKDFLDNIAVGNKQVVYNNSDYARVLLYSFMVQIDHGNRKHQKLAAFTSVCRKVYLTQKGTSKQTRAILLGGRRACIAYDVDNFHIYDIDLFYSKLPESLGDYYKDREGFSVHAPFNVGDVELSKLVHLLPSDMLTVLDKDFNRVGVTIEESATVSADIHTNSYNVKMNDGYSIVTNESGLPYCTVCAKGFRDLETLKATQERWNDWAGLEAGRFWTEVRRTNLDVMVVGFVSYSVGSALASAAAASGVASPLAPAIAMGTGIGGPVLYANTMRNTLDNILIFNGNMSPIEKTIRAEQVLFGNY